MPQAPAYIPLNCEGTLDLSSLSFYRQHDEVFLQSCHIRFFSVKLQRCTHIWQSYGEVISLLSFYLPLRLGFQD